MASWLLFSAVSKPRMILQSLGSYLACLRAPVGDKESHGAGEDLCPGVIEHASKSLGFCGTNLLFSQT